VITQLSLLDNKNSVQVIYFHNRLLATQLAQNLYTTPLSGVLIASFKRNIAFKYFIMIIILYCYELLLVRKSVMTAPVGLSVRKRQDVVTIVATTWGV